MTSQTYPGFSVLGPESSLSLLNQIRRDEIVLVRAPHSSLDRGTSTFRRLCRLGKSRAPAARCVAGGE